MIEACAAVAKAKADFMTAKAAGLQLKLQTWKPRRCASKLMRDGLIKPAPTADTELASSTKKQRTVATQSV